MTKFDYDVFKVISTIYKSIFEFIDEVSPNGLIFGADNDSKTRVKNIIIIYMNLLSEIWRLILHYMYYIINLIKLNYLM